MPCSVCEGEQRKFSQKPKFIEYLSFSNSLFMHIHDLFSNVITNALSNISKIKMPIQIDGLKVESYTKAFYLYNIDYNNNKNN